MILAIDTLTQNTALCFSFLNSCHSRESGNPHEIPNQVGDDNNFVSKIYPPTKDQSELLIGQIEECIKEAGGNWKNLTAIIVLTGPGSFTGLRVGLSAAHGIGQALDIPVLGVSVMKAFSLLLPANTPHWVLIDSRRKDVAMAFRDENEAEFSSLSEIDIDTAQKLITEKSALVSGNGILMLSDADRLKIGMQWVDLSQLIFLMQAEIASLPTGYHAIECEPVYLRAPDVTLSKSKFEHQALCSAK